MNKITILLVINYVVVSTITPIYGQKLDLLTAEGSVVAFKSQSRCPNCAGHSGGIGIQVENWIVRVDSWTGAEAKEFRYILVEYKMYERSPSSKEIESRLRFSLLGPNLSQETDCLGTVRVEDDKGSRVKPTELGDFERTSIGKLDDLAEFRSFPCFVVSRLPRKLTEK